MIPTPFFVRPGFGDAPVGSLLAFAGTLGAPDSGSPPGRRSAQPHTTDPLEAWGWMYCDGRELSTHRYPELFAALGYVYGGSAASFKIPDLRGYFLRGNGAGTQVDPDQDQRTVPPGGQGSASGVGSIQEFAVQTHEHIYNSAPAPAARSPQGTAAGAPSATQTLTSGGPTSSLSPPGSVKVSPYETRPVNVSVNYIIKFTYGLLPPGR